MKPLKKRNFRDLSYLTNEDGYRLRPGLFFRSGALYKLSKREKRSIDDLHLSTVLDLRTPEEQHKKPDDVVGDVAYESNPLLTASAIGITHEKGLKGYKAPPNMPALYRRIVSEKESVEALAKALHTLLDTKSGPRLWHCTAGKDRAGLLTAMFLLALGYKEEDIIADYERSDKSSRKKGRLYRNLILFLLWKRKLANGVYAAMRAKADYLLSAFAAMEEQAGSLASYLRDYLHVTPEDIASFKATYMVPQTEVRKA